MLKQFSSRTIKAGLLALVTITVSVNAIEHDFSQKILVKSQFTSGDGIEKSLMYTGNVRIEQGTLVIEADEVEVLAEDGEEGKVFIARGKPATYQQIKEDGTLVKAMANEIRYGLDSRILSLQGNAELQQDSSMVKGDAIQFDMLNEQVNASGSDDQEGRVTTIFQPSSKAGNPDQSDEDDDGNP